MYESGGQIHWIGHTAILFLLMLLSRAAGAVHWHENLLGTPLVLYFGYLVWKIGKRVVQLVGRL